MIDLLATLAAATLALGGQSAPAATPETAWTWTLQADCFDEAGFTQFYADHYGHGREIVCSGGAPYANLCDGMVCQ